MPSCCRAQFPFAPFITMKVTDTSVIRFHLQVLHGITVKSIERRRDRLFISGAKVFGVPLESLPRRYIPEFGLVPWWVRAVGSQRALLLQPRGATAKTPTLLSAVSQLSGGRLFLSSGPCWDCRPVQKARLSSSHQNPQGKVWNSWSF